MIYSLYSIALPLPFDKLETCLFIGQIYRQYSVHLISLWKNITHHIAQINLASTLHSHSHSHSPNLIFIL